MHRSLHRAPSCCGKIALRRARAASMASASTGRKRSAADDDHLLRFGRKSYSSKRAIAADLQRVDPWAPSGNLASVAVQGQGA